MGVSQFPVCVAAQAIANNFLRMINLNFLVIHGIKNFLTLANPSGNFLWESLL